MKKEEEEERKNEAILIKKRKTHDLAHKISVDKRTRIALESKKKFSLISIFGIRLKKNEEQINFNNN